MIIFKCMSWQGLSGNWCRGFWDTEDDDASAKLEEKEICDKSQHFEEPSKCNLLFLKHRLKQTPFNWEKPYVNTM